MIESDTIKDHKKCNTLRDQCIVISSWPLKATFLECFIQKYETPAIYI